MLPFPIALKQEMKSCPISADHPVSALASHLPILLCITSTAVMINCIGMSVGPLPHGTEKAESLLLWLVLQQAGAVSTTGGGWL